MSVDYQQHKVFYQIRIFSLCNTVAKSVVRYKYEPSDLVIKILG